MAPSRKNYTALQQATIAQVSTSIPVKIRRCVKGKSKWSLVSYHSRHIHIHTCMYVYLYTGKGIMYIYIYIYVYMFLHELICMYTRITTYMYTYIYICICMQYVVWGCCMWQHVCVHVYTIGPHEPSLLP